MTVVMEKPESGVARTMRILSERVALSRKAIEDEQRALLTTENPRLSAEEIEALMSLDEEGEFRRQSQSLFRAMAAQLRGVSNTGQVILAGLWKARLNKMYIYIDESKGIYDAMRTLVGADIDVEYLKSLCRIVDHIFPYIYDREKEEHPVKDEKSGMALTLIEEDDEFHVNLISKPGLISKLKENSAHFSALRSDDERDELLTAIASESREYVKAVKQKQQNDAAPAHIKIAEKEDKDGNVVVTFKTTKIELEAKQWKKLKKKLLGILEFEI